MFLWSWGSNCWHEWHSSSFQTVRQNYFEVSVSQKVTSTSTNKLKWWQESSEFLSVLGQVHTNWFLFFSWNETCYVWEVNPRSASHFHLSSPLPWQNMGQSIPLPTKATSLLEKHLPCEFISSIQNMSDTMQNTTFTELASKVANESYTNLHRLEYYTNYCYRKQINPEQNVMFLSFCLYVKS